MSKMGGLILLPPFPSFSVSSSSPPTPSIFPQAIEEEDPVPLFFLDEGADLSAGIEISPPESPCSSMGTSFSLSSFPTFLPIPSVPSSKKKKPGVSAMRKPFSLKPAEHPSSPTPSKGKLQKLVRFLDRVEIVPTNPFLTQQELDQEGTAETPEETPYERKKQRTSSNLTVYSPDHLSDPGIASGLGRAGSPTNRSPNRSPNCSPISSTRNLTTSETYRSPPPPPSWRIPPSSLFGPQPHVREPPRVRSPSRPGEEVDLMVRENSRDSACYMDYPSEDDDDITSNRSSCGSRSPSPSNRMSPPTIHPVIARKWVNGEVRFEDQWGRRLIPVGREDSFKFDLWPVEEDVDAEKVGSGVQGAWVRNGGASL
ncbi:hypothetical protein RUND412_008606 [Rhizina undulata]